MSTSRPNEYSVELSARIELVTATLALLANHDQATVDGRLARVRQAQANLEALPCARGALLTERFSLTEEENAVIWLLVAVSMSSEARNVAKIVTVEASDHPTIGALRKLVAGEVPRLSAIDQLSAHGRLRRYALIIPANPGETSESRLQWMLAERVMRWLLGEETIAPELETRLIASTAFDGAAPIVEGLDVDEAATAVRDHESAVVVCSGVPSSGRRTCLRAVAGRSGRGTVEVDCRVHFSSDERLVEDLGLVLRECLILGCAPLFANIDQLDSTRARRLLDELGRKAASLPWPVVITSREPIPHVKWQGRALVYQLRRLSTARLAEVWQRSLGSIEADQALELAARYPIAPGLVVKAAAEATARGAGASLDTGAVHECVRAVLDHKLADYAKRVVITQTWDDVVLPDDQFEQLEYLVARIRQWHTVYEQWGFAAKVGKGLGTAALFSGPPGTGKTMVAGLVAQEIGLDLYQVDMSKITSKYIGETERNLAALFDAAEAEHAVLLFDEADSLFGKRTEVKSSNDRYANLETNFLLQRLESFTGICLLTSNHEASIDPAFQRRLSLHIRFEVPDVRERAHLWRAMLPTAAPLAVDVDFEDLARTFVMSGGYIRNAALRAAFMAADKETAITGAYLQRAARFEYEAMGKIATTIAL